MKTNILQNLSSKFGVYPTSYVDPTKVKSMLRNLWPVHSGHKLRRFGPKSDGGYLIPDDLEGIQRCYSPGVSNESGFEFDLAERGIDVYMADGSVDAPQLNHQRFHFLKSHIGSFPHEVDGIEFTTLSKWIKRTSSFEDKGDLLLQMDIEGFEYEVIYNLDWEIQKRFRIIVLELHDLQQLQSQFGFKIISQCLRKLTVTHDVVHLHANKIAGFFKIQDFNVPRLLEVTLLRKDRISGRSPILHLPHHLDPIDDSKVSQCRLNWNSGD
jgi:hypothetical protein